MYSTTWCGYCRRLKKQLDESGISYVEIDIEQDPASAEFVGSVNGGNHVVPTVKFADGSTATNPSLAAVKQTLATLPDRLDRLLRADPRGPHGTFYALDQLSSSAQDSTIVRAMEIDPGSSSRAPWFCADQSPTASAVRTSARVNQWASAISPSEKASG